MDLKFLIKQKPQVNSQLKRQVARDRSDRREMDMVAGLVDEKPLVIFSKSSCCMSHSTKSFLRGFGANPTVYELDQMPNGQQIERALLQRGCRPSVPAVFIGQELVGEGPLDRDDVDHHDMGFDKADLQLLLHVY
ncbi:hypothetical protein GBA52_028247 [Prunus armeniaca]|nr:hypothetical protein GBA52_028247 [Prunus armeniaca]